MSLFDVLKYQNIDLTNMVDLLNLPHDLVTICFNKEFGRYDVTDNHYRCFRIVTRCSQNVEHSRIRKDFIKILSEYNNELV